FAVRRPRADDRRRRRRADVPHAGGAERAIADAENLLSAPHAVLRSDAQVVRRILRPGDSLEARRARRGIQGYDGATRAALARPRLPFAFVQVDTARSRRATRDRRAGVRDSLVSRQAAARLLRLEMDLRRADEPLYLSSPAFSAARAV